MSWGVSLADEPLAPDTVPLFVMAINLATDGHGTAPGLSVWLFRASAPPFHRATRSFRPCPHRSVSNEHLHPNI